MNQYRRIDRDTTYNFFNLCCNYYSARGAHLLVEERDTTGGWLHNVFLGGFETIVHKDIPPLVNELLCSALREHLLERGRDRERLEPLCIRDKLRSRRAKGLTEGALFGALVRYRYEDPRCYLFSKELEEAIYSVGEES